MDTKNKKTSKEKEDIVLEKVDLDDIELMEETVTPSFGVNCPHGWFGFGCH
jgi:hypothetical protein